MADEPNAPSLEELTQGVDTEALGELSKAPNVSWLDDLTTKFKELTSAITASGEEQSESMRSISRSARPAIDATEVLRKQAGLIGDPGIETSKKLSSAIRGVQKEAQVAGSIMANVSQGAKDVVNSLMKGNSGLMKSIENIMGAGTDWMFQKTMTEGLKSMDELSGGVFSEVQKGILDVEKQAFQLRLGMGESFHGATQDVTSFKNEFIKTIDDTKVSQEDLINLQASFRGAFSAEEVVRPMLSLEKAADNVGGAFKELGATMNLTNASILVAAAKGMEASKVADMMTKAHLRLGASAEESATMLGDIALASERSGLGFEKSADAIMGATDKLAMWGSTVKSVTPLLSTFTRSLGDNQKGLAVDLLESFTQGLANMGFETKALVGLSSGLGAGRGGAIGAGLEMESLLEDKSGEGIMKASKHLMDTITKFSGGKVITRQEARENPQLNANFLMQRRLLGQMLSVDEASATRMLDAFKDMKTGTLKGSEAEAKLGQIMGEGKSVQERTIDTISEQTRRMEATNLKVGERVIYELGNRLDGLAGPLKSRLRRTLKKAARPGQGIEISDIRELGSAAGVGPITDKLINMVSKKIGAPTQTGAAGQMRQKEMIKAGLESGREKVFGVSDRLSRRIRIERQKAIEGDARGEFGEVKGRQLRQMQKGKISMSFARPILEDAIGELQQQIREVSGGQRWKELSTLQKAEITVMRERIGDLKKAKNKKFITSEALGGIASSKKERQLPGERKKPTRRLPQDAERVKTRRTRRERITVPGAKVDMPGATADMLSRGVMPGLALRDQQSSQNIVSQLMRMMHPPGAPVKQAQEAMASTMAEKVDAPTTGGPKAIEQDVKLNIKANKNVITIEVDEDYVRRVVRQIELENT